MYVVIIIVRYSYDTKEIKLDLFWRDKQIKIEIFKVAIIIIIYNCIYYLVIKKII